MIKLSTLDGNLITCFSVDIKIPQYCLMLLLLDVVNRCYYFDHSCIHVLCTLAYGSSWNYDINIILQFLLRTPSTCFLTQFVFFFAVYGNARGCPSVIEIFRLIIFLIFFTLVLLLLYSLRLGNFFRSAMLPVLFHQFHI